MQDFKMFALVIEEEFCDSVENHFWSRGLEDILQSNLTLKKQDLFFNCQLWMK